MGDVRDDRTVDADCPKPVLRRLRRDMAGSSAYLDVVMERVRRQSVRFDGAGEALVHQTWKLYADGTPSLGLWVAVQGEQVIGHALADIRVWDGHTVAWLSQVVMDDVATPELRLQFTEALDTWVKDFNAQAKVLNPQWKEFNEVLMVTHRDNDAWMRHAGYERYRAIYRRTVR